MKIKYHMLLFLVILFLGGFIVVKADEGPIFWVSCKAANAGTTTTCDFVLDTEVSNDFCLPSLGFECNPYSQDYPVTEPYVASISLPNGFVLKNCSVNDNAGKCNVINNVVTVTPFSLPFSGNMDGKLELEIPKNAEEGWYSNSGSGNISLSGHVNYTNNKIDELYVDKDAIDVDSDVTSYNYVTEKSSVRVTVNTSNAASVNGFSNPVKLNYGENKININVTSQSGVTKNYILTITRKDTRSDDSTLSYLNLSDGYIDFNSSKKDYSVTVGDESITISTEPNNAAAKIEYLDGKIINLKYDETKKARIKVTSEKGTTSTYSITLTRKDTRSNDSTLKSISLSDGAINFNSNTKNYNVIVNASKVTLYATKNNEYATISYPNGNSVNLEYGQTATLKVKVTAQTGATSIYTINLTRKDARSSDNTLKSLAVSNTNIKYNNKTTVYNAQVENNIESISISATANNSKARINGTGTKSLAVGNNSFIVKVTAENGDVKEYIVVINRKAKVTNKEDKTNKTDNNTPVKLSSDNYLKSLKIEEVALDFSKTITDYNVFVDYNITNINLSYEVSSSKAIVSMTGETNLQVGLNIIKLIVVAENGDVRTYTLNINRRPERNIVENTEIAIISAINSSDMDDIYIVAEQQSAPYNMSSSILNSLSQTGKTIIYEIVDDSAVIYQLKLIGGEITNSSGFNFEVLFNSTKEHELKELVNSALYLPVRFNYSGEIPGKLYLNIYKANEKIVSSNNLKLYEYEADKNKLNLINSIETYENVIELKIDDVDKEYVLIDNLKIANSLSDEDDNKNNNNVLYTILLSVAIVLVIILIILVIKRFINKRKNSTTTNANLNDSDTIEMLDVDNK